MEMQKIVERLQQSLDTAAERLNSELKFRLEELSRQLQDITREVQKVPDSKAVKELEESVERFADEFNTTQGKAREYIRNEILPQLRNSLEQLRGQLKRKGRQQEMEKIDRRVEEIATI